MYVEISQYNYCSYAKISGFVINVKAIIYLLLDNLHECTLANASAIKDLAKATLTKVEIKKFIMTKNKINVTQLT